MGKWEDTACVPCWQREDWRPVAVCREGQGMRSEEGSVGVGRWPEVGWVGKVNEGVAKEVRRSQEEGRGHQRCNCNRRRGNCHPETRRRGTVSAKEGYTKGKRRRSELNESRRSEEGSALTRKVVAPRGSLQWVARRRGVQEGARGGFE